MRSRTFFSLLTLSLLFASPLLAEQMTPIPPGDALGTFVVPDDVEMQLVASEPIVDDPVALAFDTEGRLFVVENRGYPSDDDNRGRVVVLEDLDGDGYYESRTVFAEGFSFPNGVMPWKGGVLVTSAPTVYFLKDTNGDNVADVREDFLTGFKLGGSTQLYVSHPTLGLDNWLYFTNGLSGGEVIDPARPDMEPVVMGSNDLRFNPLTRALESTSGQSQFGQSFDDYGHRFVCTNRKHISQVMLQKEDLARNSYAGLHAVEDEIAGPGSETQLYALSDATTTAYSHAGTFTAACGLVIYRGTALGEPYRNNGFTCDPTSNIVHRTVLEDNGPAYKGRRGREGVEFMASTDNWSRPVFLANGPDGALYLCDMYRKTIEHPQYLPKDVIGVTDFESGKGMGRIYRFVPKGGTDAPRAYTGDTHSTDALVDKLGDPEGWQRDTAHRLLLTEHDTSAALTETLRQTLNTAEEHRARLHSLYLLDGHGALDERDLLAAMADSHPALREHGIRLARPAIASAGALRDAVTAASTDVDGRVRYYAALALGDLDSEDIVEPMLAVALRDLESPWIRAAVFTGTANHVAELTGRLLTQAPEDAPALEDWIGPLARMVAQSQSPEVSSTTLAAILESPLNTDPESMLAALEGMAEGVRRNRAYDGSSPPLTHLQKMVEASEAAAESLRSFTAASAGWAASGDVPSSRRIQAIRLLGYGSFEQGGDLLGELLKPRETQEVRQAAVSALGMMADSRVAEILAAEEAWGLYTTPIRKSALSALLSRPERTAVLLDAMETGVIQAWSIDPVSRRQLTTHNDEALKARAAAIFSQLETSDRDAVYEDYKSIFALDPDPVSGREVYKNNCARCHRFADEGYDVGPDLTGIRSQPQESILLHIIKPNSDVLEGYENFVVETKDFESFSGIVAAENEETVTIRGALGVENTIRREDIETMSSASLSLMPDELEKAMTKQEMRDLIGFLKGGV